MGTQIKNVRLCRAYKTYEEWMEEDPLILYGEFAFVYNVPDYDGVRLKVGDGFHTFSELPWHTDKDALKEEDINVPGGAVRLDENGLVPIDLIPDEILNRFEDEVEGG